MTRPMSDSEVCDLIEGTNMALAHATDRIEALEKRVKVLEEKHDNDLSRLWGHVSNMPGGV